MEILSPIHNSNPAALLPPEASHMQCCPPAGLRLAATTEGQHAGCGLVQHFGFITVHYKGAHY